MPDDSAEGRTSTSDTRLDSWKAIADYLRRDQRTVRRWEQTLGLPIRRVPGGRGSSVFAYVSELDAWLQRTDAERLTPTPDASTTSEDPAAPTQPPAARRHWWIAGAAVATVVLSGLTWRVLHGAASSPLTYQVTTTEVVARDVNGAERWRYRFPADERVFLPEDGVWAPIGDGRDGVVVGNSNSKGATDATSRGGRLLRFDANGQLTRSVSLNDRWTFAAGPAAPPWDLIGLRIEAAGGGRIVAVAHHDVWSAGLVMLFDDQLVRRATFVNAGWVEAVRWLSADRIVFAGYSNPAESGMVALVDPGAMNGQSPEPATSPYRCLTCGPDVPVRYVILPRSELNRVTGSGFNRARLVMSGDRLLIRTEEVVESGQTIVDALYEFSPSLELLKASYSDRYWDMHAALETQGRIHHHVAQCPDRNGPPPIRVWEPATGWRTVGPVR